MSDLKAIEYKRFEDIKHINENGSEYWSARELAVALDYVQWRNFEKVIKENSIVVVEFYSATCKHCKKLEAGIAELSEEAGNEVYFGKVLVSDELALADEYEITSVPTLLYFKDGEIREKSIGFTHKLIIAENIKKL